MRTDLLFFSRPASVVVAGREVDAGFSFMQIKQASDIDCIDEVCNALKKIVRAEFAKGSKVFVFLHNNKIAHFSCLSINTCYVGELRRCVKVKLGEAYIYNCFTASEYRGNGLFQRALDQIVGAVKADRFHICSLSNNHSSLSVIRRSGFVQCGSVRYSVTFFLESISTLGFIGVIICK